MSVTSVVSSPRRAAVGGPCLIHARQGDHYAVHDFLRQTVQQPSDDEYAAQLDRPGYEPADRLLVVEGDRIVAHLLRSSRQLALGESLLDVVELSDLVTAPDRRGRGYAAALLERAEQEMDQRQAALGSLRTHLPELFRRRGWTLGARHSWSAARPRDVLSLLSARAAQPRRLQIRLWRQVEQAALIRLHEQACRETDGLCRRDEEQWRWLSGRGACDRVYVAVDGKPASDFDASDAIVAFACVQRGRVVELAADPDRGDARREILRRVCADAIESGELEVRVDAPADDPLHRLLQEAGGERYWVEAERGIVNMLRVGSLQRLLKQLDGAFWQRSLDANISRPSELGLSCEGPGGNSKHRIVVAKSSVQIASGKVGRSYLSGSPADIHQLVLGRLSLADAIERGRVTASTQTAVDLAAALLPELPLYRSPLDDLPAAHSKL